MTYDLIIVGAGAAGLRVGIETLKKHPQKRCCILEKYRYTGGRIVTYKKFIPRVGEVQWENGAGRISTSHKKVLKLFEKYGLTFIPIGSDVDFVKESAPVITGNRFTSLLNFYLGPLTLLSQEELQRHTLKELLDKTLGRGVAKQFYEQFPYYSEIHDLRADIALHSFSHEMGTNEGFGVCKEGLSALANAMAEEFISLGGTIIFDADVQRITSNPGISAKSGGDKSITIQSRIRNIGRVVEHNTKACVLALHSEAVSKIDGVKHIPVLRHLTMTPLLRMYAVFPTKGGVSWFSGLNKIVTDSVVRYIIPVDASRGIVMISYTDGKDAAWWMRQDETAGEHAEENVKDIVMSEIRKLFPDRRIPDPIFFKQHPWYQGCTYWLSGNYNVEEESRKSLQPLADSMPNLFMCGESFAVHQCWIESALEQADALLTLGAFSKAIA